MEKFRTVPNWSSKVAGHIIRGHNKRRLLYDSLSVPSNMFFNSFAPAKIAKKMSVRWQCKKLS